MLSKAKTLQAVLEMQKLFPDAHCELDHDTPFQLLIATILSAQATDKGVNKVTPKLFAIYPNAHALANSEEEVVIECIQSLGLYRNKAKNIRLCAQQLVERFNGEVPRTREELVQLAGVGRKTANVVLSVAFGLPAFAVDTHVERISKRFMGESPSLDDFLWKISLYCQKTEMCKLSITRYLRLWSKRSINKKWLDNCPTIFLI